MKNQLEELRRQHAIRQEDLAQALGVSRQTVISLEKGKYNPSLALAFKLARYFNLSIEDIFDDSDDCLLHLQIDNNICILLKIDRLYL